jgi:hypothetical protein
MVSAAILKRDSVLKALRNWRGSTQVQRAQAAGVARGFLSELASSMKTGSGHWRSWRNGSTLRWDGAVTERKALK